MRGYEKTSQFDSLTFCMYVWLTFIMDAFGRYGLNSINPTIIDQNQDGVIRVYKHEYMEILSTSFYSIFRNFFLVFRCFNSHSFE